MWHRLTLFAGYWLALFVAYLLLTCDASPIELCAGLACALAAAIAAAVVRAKGGMHFQFKPGWIKPLARVPGQVTSDSVRVLAAILRRMIGKFSSGRFREVEFNAGGNDAASATRRALVVAAASLAPNRFVLFCDHERGALLVHELVSSPLPADKEWPL